MNILNVVLSGIVSVIISYFTIRNFSGEKYDFHDFVIYSIIFIIFLIINCFIFDGITRLLLNIIGMITSLYFSIFKKNISELVLV